MAYFKQLKEQISYEWGRLDALEKLLVGGLAVPCLLMAMALLLSIPVIAILAVFGA